MTTPKPATGRLDNIIRDLEGLHRDAQEIFDWHVDYCLAKDTSVKSFGEMKLREIARPAGSAINYIEALKLVRKKIRGEVA
jgi:hypothetical protein